jgi:hypothetical protein
VNLLVRIEICGRYPKFGAAPGAARLPSIFSTPGTECKRRERKYATRAVASGRSIALHFSFSTLNFSE